MAKDDEVVSVDASSSGVVLRTEPTFRDVPHCLRRKCNFGERCCLRKKGVLPYGIAYPRNRSFASGFATLSNAAQ